MKTIKGPGIFLAQFIANEEPYNSIENIGKWAKSLGFKGVQIPTGDPAYLDLQTVADSKTYADEYKGKLQDLGLEITELSTHLQGPHLAVNHAHDKLAEALHRQKF